MKYLIVHTERTGSNYLCSLLHQTRIAGIADLDNCGFFIGLVGQMDRTAVEPYFKKQTTPNGVFGAKAGLSYFLLEMKKALGLEFTFALLESMNAFVWLRRHDRVAQAVSMYIAGHTKRWHSNSPVSVQERPDPPYNRREISLALTHIAAEEARAEAFFQTIGQQPLTIWYEDLYQQPEQTVQQVLHFLSIPYQRLPVFKSIFEKQHNPHKTAYVQRYRSGL